MAKVTSIDEYISAQPANVRPLLKQVRSTIRKAVPAAEEAISYGIPAFKLHERAFIYFAGWKEHYSIYPVTAHLLAPIKKQLAPYEISKGTIRFPLSGGVPVRLIAQIAKLHAREHAARMKARTAKK